MWENIIEYFSKRHLLTNFILIGVIIGGIYFWDITPKEELPDMTMDTVRITTSYPGASPEEVEHFVTRPIEDELKGVDGIYRITSATSQGSCSISVEIDQFYPDKDEVLTEIRSAVMDTELPEEVINDPFIRIFKTSKKAILDIGLYHKKKRILDYASRYELQTLAHALENQLLNLSQVNSISKQGYLQEELQVRLDPDKILRYEIPVSSILDEIRNGNIRQPAGSLENVRQDKVTVRAELDTPEKMKNLVIQGGFEGPFVRLGNVADIGRGFEKNTEIHKINGHEGVFLNVVKNGSYGILQALEAVNKVVNRFNSTTLKDRPYKLVLLDDESSGLRNRLSLIATNGIIGFTLILITLFVFLNFKSGIWVALGIPFSFCFTVIFANLFGYTINNMTLAGFIIVMGMVVDDAIVVAENITRLRAQGTPMPEAAVKGTSYVFLPVVASIVTTCAAFLPLFSFTGRISMLSKSIPPIVFLMLAGSLIESLLILPAHMNLKIPRYVRVIFSLGTLPLIEKYFSREKSREPARGDYTHWFDRVENVYGKILEKALRHKALLLTAFGTLLVLSAFIFTGTMKFIMFPNEESTEFNLRAEAPAGSTNYQTARLSEQIEDIIAPYIGREVIGFRTEIARSRWGRAADENKIFMRIEVVPREKREKSLNQLIAEWNGKLRNTKSLKKLIISKQHFGSQSGSPIEIIIQDNNDSVRETVADFIANEMKKNSVLKNVEIDRPIKKSEYRIDLKRDLLKRLGINPARIGTTLRTVLEGTVLYELPRDDEEIYMRVSALDSSKDNINKVLNVPVGNSGNYLVPLKTIVSVRKEEAPNSIARQDHRRTTTVYADMKEKSGKTPLDVAEFFEEKIFPELMNRYPATMVSFGGEVLDTRESKSDIMTAVVMVIMLIYVILALLFGSMLKPLIIMMAIPFGTVGIILAFWAHGIHFFGFFAAIGALGLTGVVVNDSIVMLTKLDTEFDHEGDEYMTDGHIADIAKTRLRAVVLTTVTTVAGLFPTAYGIAGYDSMLAEMMLALAWGLIFGTLITLFLVPTLYSFGRDFRYRHAADKIMTNREGA